MSRERLRLVHQVFGAKGGKGVKPKFARHPTGQNGMFMQKVGRALGGRTQALALRNGIGRQQLFFKLRRGIALPDPADPVDGRGRL